LFDEIFDKVEVETKKRMKTAGRLFFLPKDLLV